MKESVNYLIDKIPKKYLINADRDNKILFLNDKETVGYFWDTKVKYWALNLQITHGYKLKYI